MRLIDYHMHTRYSTDSEANPRDHVLQALRMGLDEICFTDHQDFYYPEVSFDVDVGSYYQEIKKLQEEFKDQICIKWGIEMGLDMNYKEEIEAMIKKYPFDFVIGSIHVIKDTEFFMPAKFFENKTKEEAHRVFFKETLQCVKAFDCFNVLGHLDYIVRYGPYVDKTVDYNKYKDIIDEIFTTLIASGKGIEVNTSGYAVYGNCGFPNFDLVKRYYQLGGRIISVGTDAHTSDRVGEHVQDVVEHYKKIGFKDVSTFTRGIRDT